MTLRSLLTKAHLYVASSITAAIALVACDTSTELVDPSICRDSPVYGKHLWGINECEGALHMREDCVVGLAGINGRPIYKYRQIAVDIDIMSYSGLEVKSKTGHTLLVLDPDVRAVPSEEQVPHWEKVNQKIDQYNGYFNTHHDHHSSFFRFNSSEGIGVIFENAFVPTDKPFPGEEACKDSEYYWEN